MTQDVVKVKLESSLHDPHVDYASLRGTTPPETIGQEPSLLRKIPAQAVRATVAQLAIIQAAFDKKDTPNTGELEVLCEESGLYVWLFSRFFLLLFGQVCRSFPRN